MKKPKVLLTNPIPEACLNLLNDKVDLTLLQEGEDTHERIMAELGQQEALLSLLTADIDKKLIDKNPHLKIIANVAVGYNNIDVDVATKHGIPVTNTPGVLTETSADLAFALLMATARRVVEADNFMRKGTWQGWGMLQFLGHDIHGAQLGIVGMGRIGKAVARRAKGFDMDVVYWNRTRLRTEEEQQLGLRYLPFEDLVSTADYISIHLAYNEQTHHKFGQGEFDKMKKTAHLINTARGPIVDENALVESLEKHKIAGAGLDVFEEEPKVHPKLLKMDNAVLLPHIGSATIATREKMGFTAIKNLLQAVEGKRPQNLVNPEIYN